MLNLTDNQNTNTFNLINFVNEGEIDHFRNGVVYKIKWRYVRVDSIEYVIKGLEHLGSFFAHVRSLS